jgi:succinate dehydrogenase hydrophobic anchor subunit
MVPTTSRTQGVVMGEDLAASNVNRSYSLAATSIAIFTFTLVFLYPRFASGEANPVLFQATLVAMAVATFSFVLASFHYYAASLGERVEDALRTRLARRGDRLWLLGYTLLFLVPSLILFTVGLLLAGFVWLGLWLGYVLFVARNFSFVQTMPPG